MKIVTKSAVYRLVLLAIFLVVVGTIGWFIMLRMPGKSYEGELPVPNPVEVELLIELQRDVRLLGGDIGERNVGEYAALKRAEDFIIASLEEANFAVERQTFEVNGHEVANLIAVAPGRRREKQIIVVGAHYDTVSGSPGANDNATGVAAALALARRFAGKRAQRTIRFAFFVNEEPPYFKTDEMGSLVYAKRCEERGEDIRAMLALETMGFFSDQDGSQGYPFPLGMFYPSTGNFIGFVGNTGSRGLVHQTITEFRRINRFPSEGGALPGFVPGVAWSDHWSFWKAGYPAIMVTDTAPFRYPHYHKTTDTPDKVDFDRLARVVAGLLSVIHNLSESD